MIRFNLNDISKIKINSNEITLAKLNNQIIFESKETLLYKFGLLSDIHIDGDGTDTYNTIVKFQNAINYYKNNANFVCVTGDVSFDGRESDFIKYQEITQGITVKTLSGNHDAKGFNYYTQYTNDSLYYEFNYKNDVFLFVGAANGFSYSKSMTDDELNWLQSKLEEYKQKRVFLMFHFFVDPVGNVNNLNKTDSLVTTSEQYQILLNILKNYKNIIFCTGHTHLEFGLEKYGENANFMQKGETCARIHTPSLGYPKTNDTGISNTETYNLKDKGFGYLVEVYEKKVVFQAIQVSLNNVIKLNNYIYTIEI